MLPVNEHYLDNHLFPFGFKPFDILDARCGWRKSKACAAFRRRTTAGLRLLPVLLWHLL